MATDANGNPADGQPKVEFTSEQQAKVEVLIRDAMGRAGKEAREKAAQLETELTGIKTQLATAQAALDAAKTAPEKKEAKGDVAALQATIDEMRRAQQSQLEEAKRFQSLAQQKESEVAEARKEVVNVKKRIEIANAASKVNFINNEVVTKLTEDQVKWDSEKSRFVVLGANGQPRLNAAFDPMSLEEFYTEFAAQNPYLVRGDVKTGVGSTTNRGVSNNGKYEVKQIFGKESSSILASKLMKENPAEYARLKVIARENGIIA